MSDEPEQTLICMVGLPRSGKSTWARTTPHPIVNPDAIRLALHGQPYYPGAEGMVWAVTTLMVKALFGAGHKTVILDATNRTRGRRDVWRSKSWQTRFKVISTDVETCVARAEAQDRQDLVEVIHRMAKETEPLREDEDAYESDS
jgi:predicted kinase